MWVAAGVFLPFFLFTEYSTLLCLPVEIVFHTEDIFERWNGGSE